MWTLEERRIRADLIEVFKMLNGLSGIPFESMFTLDTSKRTRGHSYKILKSRFNTDLRQHFFSERVINFWNSLDDSTVSATSLNIFKQRRLKQQRHLLQMGLPQDITVRRPWRPMPSGEASSGELSGELFASVSQDLTALQKSVLLWTHAQRCVHVIFCRCFFSSAALVGQTAELIFTKVSHVVDIRCYLRTYQINLFLALLKLHVEPKNDEFFYPATRTFSALTPERGKISQF